MQKKNPKKFSKSDSLPHIDPDRLPKHIAVIMDGNGRWAQKRRFMRIMGHRKGMEAIRQLITRCRRLGVTYVTLYAFSEDNWLRPASEVKFLMSLLETFILSEKDLMNQEGISLRAIGDLHKLPKKTFTLLQKAIDETKHHSKMCLILALSYGGRTEIVQAIQDIGQQIAQGGIRPQDIDAAMVSRHLQTRDYPDPDLLIRTSGEQRTSNFLPWQSIYSELYFTDVLWPDFSEQDLDTALLDFANRERRFGKTSQQLTRQRS